LFTRRIKIGIFFWDFNGKTQKTQFIKAHKIAVAAAAAAASPGLAAAAAAAGASLGLAAATAAFRRIFL
jgi:hypothetical protein